MADVIDAFVVTLGLDPTDFTKQMAAAAAALNKLKGQSEDTSKNIRQHNKDSIESFIGLVKIFKVLDMAIRGIQSVQRYVEQTTAATLSTGRLSTIINSSTEDIDAWGQAMKHAGGNVEEVKGLMRSLTKESQDLMTGDANGDPNALPKRLAALQQGLASAGVAYQIDPRAFAHMTADKQLMEFTKIFNALDKALGGDMRRISNIGTAAGFSDQQTRMLLQAPEVQRELLNHYKTAGVSSKEDTDAAQRRNGASIDLEQAFESLTRTVATVLTPVILDFTDGLISVIDWVKNQIPKSSGTWDNIKYLWGRATYWPGGTREGGTAPGVSSVARAPSPLTEAIYDAIAVQESGRHQLGRGGSPLISSAGAVGYMQVTPDAAKDAAKRLGIAYSTYKLMFDEGYNRTLGENEFDWDMSRYGNDRTLALAAYNAGAGRVDSWIAKFGDPREGGITDEQWAAKVPFKETRKYIREINDRLSGIQSGAAGSVGGSSTNATVNVEHITVHAPAATADSIAGGISGSLKRHTSGILGASQRFLPNSSAASGLY